MTAVTGEDEFFDHSVLQKHTGKEFNMNGQGPLNVRAIRVQFSEPFGGKASKEETEGSLAL